MRNRVGGWETNSNEAGEEIAAANRALIGGERKVWDANFLYQMALSSGDPQKIRDAQRALELAMAEDIKRKGGKMEDVLLMQRVFHGLEIKSKWWLVLAGLAAIGIIFFR